MKPLFFYLIFLLISTNLYAQVGIGTTTPKAFLNVTPGRTVLFGADTAGIQTNVNQNTSASKLIWYGNIGAFRAGGISTGVLSLDTYTNWDKANVGNYSFASGRDTKASGEIATAMGRATIASGSYAMAMGDKNIASGFGSTAMGSENQAIGIVSTTIGRLNMASGNNSVAMGRETLASGNVSITMGQSTTASDVNTIATGNKTLASGNNAITMGRSTTASGKNALAMGQETTASGNNALATGTLTEASGNFATAIGFASKASGDNSTALGGFMATNNQRGSFAIGDMSALVAYKNSAQNQMMMRFGGGYILYSSPSQSQSAAIGVQLATNGNAWQTLSDSTRKEKFQLADGASFLKKIAGMRLGSWNYKGQDAEQYRHYGPMAQDFFAAFGHDALGTIGENKSINQADFDGVNLIAIQALIRKVEKLEAANEQLRTELRKSTQNEQTIQSRLDIIEAILTDRATNAAVTFKP